MDLAFEFDRIINGKCLDVLRTLPDESVDAVITDPPYGLGTHEPTPEEIEAYLRGGSLDTGGDFMSYEWEIPSVEVWKECHRVLKQGGYVLSFAGTRTWDLMSLGLRVAGFENRDTFASQFGPSMLQWVHGQGFPKSLNIAKAIAKLNIPNAAELAKKWEGYGTSLKPSWEPILCFRKPMTGTVGEQYVLTGTGGLNIDATRVRHADAEDLEKHRAMVAAIKARGGSMANSWKNSSDLSGANDVKEGGRWPGNVILIHSDACRQVGTRKVDAPIINRFDDGMKPFGNGAGHAYTGTQTGDENGQEEIAVYECVDGCPAKRLTPDKAKYHVQFMPDAPFFYAAKASRAERNEDVAKKVRKPKGDKKLRYYTLKDEAFEDADLLQEIYDVFVERMADAFPGTDVTQLELDLDGKIFEEIDFVYYIPEKYREHFEAAEPNGNNHPTVKPIALMKYLVTLVTPPGHIVLDPYCGSGTTCKAALLEGRQFLGIEMDQKFYEIARARVSKKLEEKRAMDQSIADATAVVLGDVLNPKSA